MILNEIVICDFGMATKCDIDQETFLMKSCGSPGYIAPEVLDNEKGNGKRLEPSSDIFSMGVIFYIL